VPLQTGLQPDRPSGLIASIPFVSMITAIVSPTGAETCVRKIHRSACRPNFAGHQSSQRGTRSARRM